jgi:ethanolamine utilization microcompartment shell protein EutL
MVRRSGSDFQEVRLATLAIPEGRTSGRILVLIYGDDTAEQDEALDIVLTNLRNAAFAGDAPSQRARLTIVDDD